MANTYVQIGSTVTVGAGGAATIDFTSIPSTYTDLVVKISARGNAATIPEGIKITLNSDTGTSYARSNLYGNGATPSAESNSGQSFIYFLKSLSGNSTTASTFGNAEIYFANYTASTEKSISFDGVGENNATTAWMSLAAGSWTGTAAINAISIMPTNSTAFVQYSTASLYGIKKN